MEILLSEFDELSARLTVLETVVKQFITHAAVRDENPSRWIQTRKTLAMRALGVDEGGQTALLHDAMTEFFDQAEAVAAEYSDHGPTGTRRPFAR
jgi:hypothetical protein